MLHEIISESQVNLLVPGGILFAFIVTVFALVKLSGFLPRDAGREFAHDGQLSKGKPKGAGIIFVLVFVVSALLFAPVKAETVIYLILIVLCMMTGYLDDVSRIPWGRFRKGVLDVGLAALTVMTFLTYNSNTVWLLPDALQIVIPKPLFVLCGVFLVGLSINVTNCSDGVDGLSGTLTIITIMTVYVLNGILDAGQDFSFLILLFAVCILGYLWFNCTPSRLLMGDAGSRAMGLFISLAVLKTQRPLLYIPVALVLLFDGGLGLVKITLIRLFKIHIMKQIRLPFHDHVRKAWGWSNTQTVYRFAIIQIIAAVATVYSVRLF